MPDSTAENRSALQRRPEVQGLLERKNHAASERSDLLKSRQGIGWRASLDPEPQLTQSHDNPYTLL